MKSQNTKHERLALSRQTVANLLALDVRQLAAVAGGANFSHELGCTTTCPR